jgi:hypothetical protein
MLAVTPPAVHASLRASDGLILSARRAGSTQALARPSNSPGIIGRFDRMDERFDRVEVRLDRMDERLDRVDERFGRVDERFDQMDERFNHRRSCMLRSLSVAVLLPAACALVLSAAPGQPTAERR